MSTLPGHSTKPSFVQPHHHLRFILAAISRTVLRCAFDVVSTLLGIVHILPLFTVRGNGRKRIAFQVYSEHLVQFYTPIVKALAHEDIDIHWIVLCHPYFPLGTMSNLKRFAVRELGIRPKNVHSHWEILWMKFDVCVFNDVYARFPFRRTCKILLKHGVGIIERHVSRNLLRKTFFDFDFVFLSGENDLSCLESRGYHRRRAWIVTGAPYLDRLFTKETDRPEPSRPTSRGPEKKVLIAPSWRDFTPDHLLQVLTALENLPVRVTLKLHYCSLQPMMAGYAEWADIGHQLSKRGIVIDEDIDDVPAMMDADVLITSPSSSRSIVFMAMGKPVVLYPACDSTSAMHGVQERGRADIPVFPANTPAKIKEIVGNAAGRMINRQSMQGLREFYLAHGGMATEVVADELKKRLAKESSGR